MTDVIVYGLRYCKFWTILRRRRCLLNVQLAPSEFCPFAICRLFIKIKKNVTHNLKKMALIYHVTRIFGTLHVSVLSQLMYLVGKQLLPALFTLKVRSCSHCNESTDEMSNKAR